MNRRTTIKSLLGLTAVGLTSFSVFEWVELNAKIDPAKFGQKKHLIAELAEVIIPRTDTPGAKDAKVEDFIIDILQYCTDHRTQHNFYTGLENLEEYTLKNHNNPFGRCTLAQKTAVLTHYEQKATYSHGILNKISGKFLGIPFFTKLKQLTVEGYCTSQKGATQGLAYDYIPGGYQACISLAPHQKSWATK